MIHYRVTIRNANGTGPRDPFVVWATGAGEAIERAEHRFRSRYQLGTDVPLAATIATA